MRVNQLKRFLMSCTPNTEVGVTILSKEGPQFWEIEGNGLSIFKSPDGAKCLSLLEARKNDPYPEGAIVKGIDMLFDDIPTNPDAIITELKNRFEITPYTNGRKPEELSDDELTEVLFRCIHQEIGNLICLNNNLLVYVKNKFKMQKKYWINVESKNETKV